MDRICVVTTKSKAYYTLVSRLRRAGLPFYSLMPESNSSECGIVLTTADEVASLGRRALALEDLDESPGVFRAQIVSRLVAGDDAVLVGIDPGKRTGLAVFCGQTSLAFSTFHTVGALYSRVRDFAAGIPDRRFIVRIGNGNMAMASRLAEGIRRTVPRATVEIVDESGTSARKYRIKGVQGDQGAAARIAFRRGEVFGSGTPRTPG